MNHNTDPQSPLFRQIVSEQDCRAVLLTALLHDLGHFPLAHDLEEIDKDVFSHSDLTLCMLKGESDRKKRGSKRIPFDSLGAVFEAWNTTPERIEAILAARPGIDSACRKDKLLRSIIDGALDADKIDYLFRDARHTDVPYVFGVDVDRLWRCLTTVVVDRVEGGVRHVPTIGIHAKGKVAAEFLTLARYAMFSQVYWHHTVRAQKAMIFRAVTCLLAQLKSDEERERFRSEFIEMVTALPEVLYETPQTYLFPEMARSKRIDFGSMGEGTELAPTDAAVLLWLREGLRKRGRTESALIDGVLKRCLFKRLWVLSSDMESTRFAGIVALWDRIAFDHEKRQKVSFEFEKAVKSAIADDPVPVATLTELKPETAKEKMEMNVAGEIPWLLVDIPGGRPGAEIGLHYVLESQRRQLRKDTRAVGDLRTSEIWERYGHKLRETAGKIRIFAQGDLVDFLEETLSIEQGMDVLRDVLEKVH